MSGLEWESFTVKATSTNLTALLFMQKTKKLHIGFSRIRQEKKERASGATITKAKANGQAGARASAKAPSLLLRFTVSCFLLYLPLCSTLSFTGCNLRMWDLQ